MLKFEASTGTMFDNFLQSVQVALTRHWERRRKVAEARAVAAIAEGMSVEEAYRRAYRSAYWDGVLDLIQVITEDGVLGKNKQSPLN